MPTEFVEKDDENEVSEESGDEKEEEGKGDPSFKYYLSNLISK